MLFSLIGDDKLMAIVNRAVLDERIDGRAIGGEIGNLVGLSHDELSIQDVVISVVALVDHERKFDHHARGVAVAVGAGIGLVGRDTVESEKIDVVHAVYDDAAAGALHVGGKIEPATGEVQLLVLKRVGIDGDGRAQKGPVGVLWILLASV